MILSTVNFSQVKYAYFRKLEFVYVPGKYPHLDCFRAEKLEYEEYNPFEITDLYERFANLDESNPESILGFINEHGPIKWNLESCPQLPYTERIEDWRHEIRQMRKAICMKDLYLSENIITTAEAWRDRLERFKECSVYQYLAGIKNNINKCVFSIKEAECTDCGECKNVKKASKKEMLKQTGYDLKIASLIELQQIFNHSNSLGEVSLGPYIDINADDSPCFVSALKFKTLLSAMYWQLYLVFFERKPIFICESCKGKFEWGKKNKIFLCEECQNKSKYRKRAANPKLRAHDQFARRTAYHANGKEAWSLREKIMKESLQKAKNEQIPEKEYKKWLGEQNDIFMAEIKNIGN
jgi:hypothetical protein